MSRFRAAGRAREVHAARPPSSLPVRLTSFVGRAHETAYLIDLLRRERSATLVGAPGVGKTSLAIQVAAALRDDFDDGVWFVELAGLSDPTLTPSAVAGALGVPEQPGRTVMTSLTEHVASRELLLVLDNCEHVILACATLVEELLRAGPGVRVLATSREALRHDGEVTWRVPSLSVPDESGDVTRLHAYEAVQLFASRARAAVPTFALSAENGRAVAEICRRLDGIPLAIELAAGRIGALSVDEVAARLGDRLVLSSMGRRTAIPRQPTLRAAIDWSFELLSEEERTLLRRLAVFAGGWTVPAAEAIRGEPTDPTTVDLLVQLVERSLVQVEPGGGREQRYRLLEMIRQFGLEQLRATGEEAAIRRRHLTWFSELAERGQEGIHGHDGARWLDRLAIDLDNLRSALAWSIADQEPLSIQAGLRMAGALYQFWLFRDHTAEGSRWMEQVLAADEALAAARRVSGERADADEVLPPARKGAFGAHPRVVVLAELAGMVLQLGDAERGAALAEEARSLADATGSPYDLAHALVTLARNLDTRGQSARAVALHEESLLIFRRVGDGFGMWRGLSNFGETLIQVGDLDQAGPLLDEALAAGRAIGHPWGVAQALRQLGVIALRQGRLDRATRLLEEARAGWIRLGATDGLDRVLIDLGHLALARRQPLEAMQLFAESLALHRVPNRRRTVARSLVGLVAAATATARSGADERAEALVTLLAAATSMLDSTNGDLTSHDRPAFDGALTVLRGQLDADAFETARADGRAMPSRQAVDLAFEIARQIEADPATEPDGESSTSPSPALILTPREREIAVLVGRGYTNRRIAQELTIAEKTAEVHARNIREKLGLSTRAQIAAWVVQHGLLAGGT